MAFDWDDDDDRNCCKNYSLGGIATVILVVGADSVRQVIDLGTGRLPIGVLTILVGGPMFLWLLRREVHSREG